MQQLYATIIILLSLPTSLDVLVFMMMIMIITMLLIQNTDGQPQFRPPSTLPITWILATTIPEVK